MAWSLLLAALFQMSCHSSWQNLETRGISSQAGSFMLVTVRSRAALAAVHVGSLVAGNVYMTRSWLCAPTDAADHIELASGSDVITEGRGQCHVTVWRHWWRGSCWQSSCVHATCTSTPSISPVGNAPVVLQLRWSVHTYKSWLSPSRFQAVYQIKFICDKKRTECNAKKTRQICRQDTKAAWNCTNKCPTK